MKLFEDVIRQLFHADASEAELLKSIGGGCINHAVSFSLQNKKYFLKWNQQVDDLFEKEAKGLKLLRSSKKIGIPEVIGFGQVDVHDYLCLELIESERPNIDSWKRLGENLAKLHQTSANHFGLNFDNHIGRLPQSNQFHSDWNVFFIEERLQPQIQRAFDSQLIDITVMNLFENLFTKIDSLFPEEKPALIHGDLWSGNVMFGPNQEPYIFDPAVYFGHREAEIAFTRIFGGFKPAFYSAYHEAFPLESGFEHRIDLYNLYPLLVHVNLFGSSYLPPIERTLKQFA